MGECFDPEPHFGFGVAELQLDAAGMPEIKSCIAGWAIDESSFPVTCVEFCPQGSFNDAGVCAPCDYEVCADCMGAAD